MASILIVDDDARLRRTWRAALTQQGHQVHGAACCAEARRLLEQERFDVVLLDLALPGESGLDLVPIISHLDPLPGVVVISGSCAEPETTLRLAKRGLWGLTKPVSHRVLLEAVEEWSAPQARAERLVAGYAEQKGLSPRETEVLVLTLCRVPPKEQAERLRCSTGTLRSHWDRIFGKTGCHSRADVLADLTQWLAARSWLRLGGCSAQLKHRHPGGKRSMRTLCVERLTTKRSPSGRGSHRRFGRGEPPHSMTFVAER